MVFLLLNDIEVNAREADFEKLVFKVASGKAKKEEIAEFLHKNRD